MIFSGPEPNAGLLKCDFSYSCAAVDKISTDVAGRVVPLRQLSYLQLIVMFKKTSFIHLVCVSVFLCFVDS